MQAVYWIYLSGSQGSRGGCSVRRDTECIVISTGTRLFSQLLISRTRVTVVIAVQLAESSVYSRVDFVHMPDYPVYPSRTSITTESGVDHGYAKMPFLASLLGPLFSSVLLFNLSVSCSFCREYTQNGPLHHANTFILCPAAVHEYGVHTPSSDTGDPSSMMAFNSPCSHYCSLESPPRTVPA